MTTLGRRPGNQDTRAAIVQAARAAFIEKGYQAASIRGIARDAGVDPSLVHHYFDGKAALFVAALDLPADPRDIKDRVQASTMGDGDGPVGGRRIAGSVLVELFLGQWEVDDPPGSRFRAMAQAMSSSPAVADAVRQFLAERVWSRITNEDPRRTALVSAQLVGLAWGRYILRTEPLASAPLGEIGRLAGPTIDRYMTADLDS